MIHWNPFFLYQMNKNDAVVLGTQVCLFEGIKYSTLPRLPLSSSNIKHLICCPHSQIMALLPIEARRQLPFPGGLTMTSYLHRAMPSALPSFLLLWMNCYSKPAPLISPIFLCSFCKLPQPLPHYPEPILLTVLYKDRQSAPTSSVTIILSARSNL